LEGGRTVLEGVFAWLDMDACVRAGVEAHVRTVLGVACARAVEAEGPAEGAGRPAGAAATLSATLLDRGAELGRALETPPWVRLVGSLL